MDLRFERMNEGTRRDRFKAIKVEIKRARLDAHEASERGGAERE